MHPTNRRPAAPTAMRGGSVLVCVIVCMAVATAIVASVTRSALQNRRQARVEHQVRQAELLLEAGIHRAIAKLQTQAKFEGETWSLEADAIPRFGPAVVEIKATTGKRTNTRNVLVTASLKRGKLQTVRRSYEFVFQSSTSPDPSQSNLPETDPSEE